MDIYVVDAHGLIWFITESSKLSQRAAQILEKAENAEVEVLIPTIVLAEITYIAQKKRVEVTIDEVLERIQQGNGFAIVPFDFPVFQESLQMPEDWEIHDRIIAATARYFFLLFLLMELFFLKEKFGYYDAKLITKDEILQKSDEVETIW